MSRITLLAALACAISPGFAHKVRVDFDHTANLSGYHTYSWGSPACPPGGETIFPNQLMRQRVTGFIEEAMAARGFKRVQSGGDLMLSYRIDVTEQPQYITFYDWAGPDWQWGNGYSTTTLQIIYDGTLVVDVTDANRKQLVFQGTSTQTISSRPAENTKKLAKAVNEVFQRYPFRP